MQQVLKVIVSSLILFVSLNAKEIPLAKTITLWVPLKEYSVIELPFEIVSKKPSSFIATVKKDGKEVPKKYAVSLPKPGVVRTPQPKVNPQGGKSPKTGKNPTIKKNVPIAIDWGKNNLTIFPKMNGHMEVVVWSKQGPMLIKLIVDEDMGDKYYKFVDYEVKKEKADTFENAAHERVIERLMFSMFNHKTPKGYTKESFYSKFKMAGVEYVLVQSLYGKRYIAEEYRATNMTGKDTKLYGEQFLDSGIYAASLENDKLGDGETTRLFIVRAFDKENENE